MNTTAFKFIRGFAIGAALSAGIAMFTPALLAAETQPSQTTATFGNWTVRCQPVSGTGTKACEMLQAISTTSGTIANLAIGRLPGNQDLRLVVQLPIGVSLSETVDIEVPGADVTRATFEACFPNLCVAQATLSDDALEAFKASDALTIAFKDRTKKNVALKASLNGFSAAYGSMQGDE